MQLPVHQFNFGGIRANIPLAAGYLKAMAAQEGLLDEINLEILDPETADLLGDAGLIDKIADQEIDVLGITCYCWNVTRSLYIAGELKKRLPRLKVVVGGPEITPDNPYILSHPVVDIGVINEGEKTFVELLRHFSKGIPRLPEIRGLFFKEENRILITSPRASISNLAEVPSPYLTGIIGPSRDHSMWIETVRGCRFHCEYCYYYKMFTHTLAFPLERLAQHLDYAHENGVQEIYIMDPTFNDRKDLEQVGEVIQTHNRDRSLHFHTEIRADLVDEKMADLFKRCNFKSVEVGLQSINPEALKKVGRRNNLDRFLKGVHLLKDRGIRVTVGIIIGLPGDNFSTIAETVDFLIENEAYSEVEVYNLSVLPGTVLRANAEKLGLKYQPEPPYYVLETETMSGTDLRKAQEYCAERLEVDIDPIPLPPLTTYMSRGQKKSLSRKSNIKTLQDHSMPFDSPMNPLITKVILELDGQTQTPSQMKNLAESLKTHIANCFTAWFTCQNLPSEAKLIEAFLSPIVQANPHGIFSVILETENPFPIEILEELLAYASNPNHFLNRYYLFSSSEENTIYSTQFVVVLPLHKKDQMDSRWIEDVEACIPVIWSWKISSEKEIYRTLKALQDKDGVLIEFSSDLDEETVQKILQGIKRIASDDPDWIQFRDARIQRIWDYEGSEVPPACEIGERVLHYTMKLEVFEGYLMRTVF